MIVDSIRIQNFRCVLDSTLPCASLTALVGPNGAGKSCFLRALDLFYSGSQRVDKDDFYDCDTSNAIEITLTFTELEADEQDLFRSYVRSNKLAVTRRITMSDGKLSAHYHGLRLQNPEFAAV